MQESLIPPNEAERMELLHQLDILDTEAEEIYDGIVYIASQICHVPVSTITFVDHDRQWYKSAIGTNQKENPRVVSFCARTILGKDIMEIPDSRKDERFRDNPLVTSDPYVIFYAAVPLELKDGLNVGALCVIDHKPNKLTEEQIKTLRYLGLQVTKLLELRLKNVLLLKKQKALNEDLDAASTIQKSFLPPSFFQLGGFQIASLWNPAHLLGGDIFNVIKAKEKIIFYMIDVSGHDVPSALVTVSVSQFIYQHVNSCASLSPKGIIKALNDEYPLERFDRYFTIFCLVIDPLKGHFKYSSAAHPPAIILKKNGIKLLEMRGTVIGLKADVPFEEGEGVLEEGDKVFLYTDGIPELKNQAGEEFGAERFYALLESLQKESIDQIVKEVYAELRSFNCHFKDDISLLGFEKVSAENESECARHTS